MLNLKKKLFTIALSLFCAGQLMAVPALPGKMVAFTLPSIKDVSNIFRAE